MNLQEQRRAIIDSNRRDALIHDQARSFFNATATRKYSYCFDCLVGPSFNIPGYCGIPRDSFSSLPDIIVKTGIAHGGSLVLSASLLCLLDAMEGLDPRESSRKVIGVDDIRQHNRKALDDHPLRFKIELIEGSSIDSIVVEQVKNQINHNDRVLVSLDSNHTRIMF